VEGDGLPIEPDVIVEISIHALRGEGDVLPDGAVPVADISIHVLRGEGDVQLF